MSDQECVHGVYVKIRCEQCESQFYTDRYYDALEKISIHDFSILPVVSGNDNAKLLGILTRRDIIGAYNKALIKKSIFNK